MKTLLQNGERFLFIGDSITDCGRRDAHAPLGNGYVHIFHDLLIAREPEKQVTIINRGIGGNTVENLRSRWTDDALSQRADWISIKIGINDCNQHLTRAGENCLAPAEYGTIYRELLEATRHALPATRLLLISPFFLSADTAPNSYRAKVVKLLPEYIAIVQALAGEFDALHLPLHDVFRSHLTHRHMDEFGKEPVHPNSTGHTIIAESVYRTLLAAD